MPRRPLSTCSRKQGITRALVGGAGDIVVGDPPPDARGWKIAIAPLEPGKRGPHRVLLLANAAVSTAGDAERYVIIDGHRYSHIINPSTGLGVEDRASVTVVAPDGATADALETTVYIMGPERGLKLVDDTPGAAAIFVRSTPEGIKTFESSRFKQVPLGTARLKDASHESGRTQPVQVGPEAGIRLGDAARVEDRHSGDSQAGQGERHGHAVVVVGGDAVLHGADREQGVDHQAVGLLVDPAPSWRSSVASAAMRSVSLWRMWATLRIRDTPSAKSATTAWVMTVSENAFMSTSTARSGPP